MTAERMIKVWAAKRLEIMPEQVISVRFEHEEGFAYSEYTWEPESNGAVVKTYQGDRYISVSNGIEGFQDLLAEIIEAAGQSA